MTPSEKSARALEKTEPNDDFETKAWSIVRAAWDRAPHLELENVLAASIAHALRDAQPKYPSDEEIETFAIRVVEDRDWIHNENRRALGEAVACGARWAIEKMKGEK
jgi:hypothetical protein